MDNKIIVIGAGIGGIATAIKLAARGYNVTVLEQADRAGGKINEIHKDGFRFDTGPSLFTLPELVDELFQIAGKEPREYLPYKKLKNICKYHYEDGIMLNAWAEPEKFAGEAAGVLGEPRENILAYLDKARAMYELSSGLFIFRPFSRLETFRSQAGQKVAKKLHKLDMHLSMHRRNRRSFKNPHLVQLFDRYATYNGSNPYRAPATLNMIAHLEHNKGAYFPDKGMYDIVNSLVRLASGLGVSFHFNSKAEKIVFERKNITGVTSNGTFFPAAHVICNIDVTTFYKNLMPNKKVPLRISLMKKSSSAVIFYWGMNREFPELELHNIFFAKNYKDEFEYLFKKKKLYHDPTVYVFISHKATETDAPEGCENWFVMINAPENKGQYNAEVLQTLKNNIIQKLNRLLQTNIETHIISETIGTPVTIEHNTGSAGGAIYGNNSNSRFSAFMRHPNRISRLPGLHFAGGSVHPGGGIPLCIASAGIVDRDIPEFTQ